MAEQYVKLRIRDIVVDADRTRKEMGDIQALADSMQRVGQLHAIGVNAADNRLIIGTRRLKAAQLLGWTEIDVRLIGNLESTLELLQAERDENTCRKNYTPLEIAAIGRRLEDLERPKAKERQREGGRHGGEASGKFPEALKGTTRDKVAEALGTSGRTYDKIKQVAIAAEEDPARFGDIAEEMDRTGKVEPAYQEVKPRRLQIHNPDGMGFRQEDLGDGGVNYTLVPRERSDARAKETDTGGTRRERPEPLLDDKNEVFYGLLGSMESDLIKEDYEDDEEEDNKPLMPRPDRYEEGYDFTRIDFDYTTLSTEELLDLLKEMIAVRAKIAIEAAEFRDAAKAAGMHRTAKSRTDCKEQCYAFYLRHNKVRTHCERVLGLITKRTVQAIKAKAESKKPNKSR